MEMLLSIAAVFRTLPHQFRRAIRKNALTCLPRLYVEPEQHNVAVLYDIIFSFKADQTFFFCRRM